MLSDIYPDRKNQRSNKCVFFKLNVLKTKAATCPSNVTQAGTSNFCDPSKILSTDEQAQMAKLERELDWYNAEFGSISKVLQNGTR
jgi:hypothetical protein